jgi:hypothetical protein
MEFDHLRDKTSAISLMVHDHCSLKRIKEEIAKCDLVCVLCHKDRTHRREQPRVLSPTQLRNKAVQFKAKDRPCELCLKRFHPWRMEFDHRDPDNKRLPVSTMVITNYAVQAIETEIAKCRLLCSLCHRRETFRAGKYKKYSSGDIQSSGSDSTTSAPSDTSGVSGFESRGA